MTHPHICQADRDLLDDGLVLDAQPAYDDDTDETLLLARKKTDDDNIRRLYDRAVGR